MPQKTTKFLTKLWEQ